MRRDHSSASHRLQPASSGDNRLVRRDSMAIRANVMATALTEDIPGPAAIINEDREVVFANELFLRIAHAETLDDVVGARIVSSAGHDAPAFGEDDYSALGQVQFTMRAVPLRLRERTFLLVQVTLVADDAEVGV